MDVLPNSDNYLAASIYMYRGYCKINKTKRCFCDTIDKIVISLYMIHYARHFALNSSIIPNKSSRSLRPRRKSLIPVCRTTKLLNSYVLVFIFLQWTSSELLCTACKSTPLRIGMVYERGINKSRFIARQCYNKSTYPLWSFQKSSLPQIVEEHSLLTFSNSLKFHC